MKLSVIVPLYNKAPYIQRALESVFAQTWVDYEILVVDDGSTDEGAKIVRRFRDPRLRVISQANAGPGASRNRGLKEAQGAYVAFLDADDEWLPAFLERSVAVLDRPGRGLATVSSGYLLYPGGRSTEEMWRKRGLREGIYEVNTETPPRFLVYLLAYLSPWNTMARRDVLLRWGGFFSENRCVYGEDSYLWLKILMNEPVGLILEPLACFHTEASALSGNLSGARPVEPILTNPEGIEACCPDALRTLLRQVLTLRAIKTACVLSYWGQWREGRKVLRQFVPGSGWHVPGLWVAQLCATPLGALAGRAFRLMRQRGSA